MKKRVLYLLVGIFSVLPASSWSQADSLKTKKQDGFILYLGVGGGWNNRGGNGQLSLTIASAKGLGGSINLLSGIQRLKNIPDDYYSFFFRWTSPTNSFTILSFNLVKKFTDPSGLFRFGIEAGPSAVWYNETTLELNPGYPDLFEYKYNVIHTPRETVGFTMAIKAECPFFKYMGCDISFYTNLNSICSIAGLELSLQFGKVK